MSSRIPKPSLYSTPTSLTKSQSGALTPPAPGELATPDSAAAFVKRTSVQETPTSTSKRDAGEAERVKVVLRIRPALHLDSRDEHSGALVVDNNHVVLHRPDAPVAQSEFVFDKVLGPASTQHDVYMAGVKDVVEDVLMGYNGTVMAYGQTGAGKTYTLGNTEPSAIGMIPRCVAEIFKQAAADPFHSFSVSMSYIQIYMELIQDLLKPESENLVIREDATNGVYLAGVHEVPVTTLEECLHYLELGERNRTFAFTHLNAHSSRSHAVVMVTVVKSRKYLTAQEKAEMKKVEKEGMMSQKVKVGKLYLVDLAGSERLKKSRSVGLRASEAKSINLSLTTLGMCISARASEERHVPFRDSKLTRLLQESLGGNAKTTLVVCVADAKQHVDESLQSLQFGSRAMCVKNKPVVNERIDYRMLHAELLAQMDKTGDRAHELEVAILRTEEERDALKTAMDKEKEHFEAIISALRCEGEDRVAAVHNELVTTIEVVRKEKAERSEIEDRLRRVEEDNARMAEVHYQEVTALNKQVKDLLEAHATATNNHKREAAAAAAELERTQQQLVQAKSHGRSLEEANERLQRELDTLRSAQSQWHRQLTQLHQAMRDALPSTLPVLPGVSGSGQGSTSDATGLPMPPLQSHASAPIPVSPRLGPVATTPLPSKSSLPGTTPAKPPLSPRATPGPATGPQRPPAVGVPSNNGSLTSDQSHRLTAELLAPDTPMATPGSGLVDASDGGAGLDGYMTTGGAIFYSPASSSPDASPAPVVGRPVQPRVYHGQTGAVQDTVTAVAETLMPQLAQAVMILQTTTQSQAATIAQLESEVASGLERETAMSQTVTSLTSQLNSVTSQLNSETAVCKDLQKQVSQLKSRVASQEDELSVRHATIEQLTAQLSEVDQALAVEREQHAALDTVHRAVQGQRHEAHTYRMDVRRRSQSAAVIQRAFRRWREDRLRAKAEQDAMALNALEIAREDATRAAQLQAAQIGTGMVLESMTVIREAVEALLTTFVGRRKELELRDQLALRVQCAAPMISQAKVNATLSQLALAGNTSSRPVTTVAATMSPKQQRGIMGRRAASAFGAALGASAGGVGPSGRHASMTGSGPGPMTLPRNISMTRGVVAPVFTDFSSGPGRSLTSSFAASPTKVAVAPDVRRSMTAVAPRLATDTQAAGGRSILERCAPPPTAPHGLPAAAPPRPAVRAECDPAVASTADSHAVPVQQGVPDLLCDPAASVDVADSLSAAANKLRTRQAVNRPVTSSAPAPAVRGSVVDSDPVMHHKVYQELTADSECMGEHDPQAIAAYDPLQLPPAPPRVATKRPQSGTGMPNTPPAAFTPLGVIGVIPMLKSAGSSGHVQLLQTESGESRPATPSLAGTGVAAATAVAATRTVGYSTFSAAAAALGGANNVYDLSPSKAGLATHPSGGGIGRFQASESPVKGSGGGKLPATAVGTPTVDVPPDPAAAWLAGARAQSMPVPSNTQGKALDVCGVVGEDGLAPGEATVGQRAAVMGGHTHAARSLLGALKKAATTFKQRS